MSDSNNSKLKKTVLQSLILVSAYGAVAGSESMKKGTKRKQREDNVCSTLAELLYQSYHGTEYLKSGHKEGCDKEGNKYVSHVDMF